MMLYIILHHVTHQLTPQTLLSPPLAFWFTSQSFYTPNFIFHLTSLILFVNKAPLPYRHSRKRLGKTLSKWEVRREKVFDRFQVKTHEQENFDKVQN